jgi:histidinol dehydrogenase
MSGPLRTIGPSDVASWRARVWLPSPETQGAARRIIDDVSSRGWAAVVDWSRRLGDVPADAEPAVYEAPDLRRALDRVDSQTRALLERSADRVRGFAEAQRACFSDLSTERDGIASGHRLVPVRSAGCYVPGGRFPLPSTALMTAIPARVAGVDRAVVVSPRPADATLAAAAVAGADLLIGCGGAQAVAALALGAGPVPACDVVVGPGNRYVTAAKQLLFGVIGIDMLAGPTEVLIVADASADADLVAADLLAQAEHDDDARALLVTDSPALIERVNEQLRRQLIDLPTAATASRALAGSFALKCASIDECADVASRIAPEHLTVLTRDPAAVAERVRDYGIAFLGERSAEVLADYAAGPNHVLPTSGTARFASGLSVLHFLTVRTWLRAESARASRAVYADAERFARVEGLEAHARAAAARQRRA